MDSIVEASELRFGFGLIQEYGRMLFAQFGLARKAAGSA